MSSNPLGNDGIKEIIHGMKYSHTLHTLTVAYCQIDNDGMANFQSALSANPYILRLEMHENPISTNMEVKTLAESVVNNYLVSLTKDHMAVNADTITHAVLLPLTLRSAFSCGV